MDRGVVYINKYMKVEIVVNRRIERLYEEYMTLIDGLKGKRKDERFELYESMTKRLYPHAEKVVDLEAILLKLTLFIIQLVQMTLFILF